MLLMVLGGCVQGFTKSLAMTVLSEIGDKTFFAAAVRLLFPIPPHVACSSSCPFACRACLCLRAPCPVGALPPGVRRYAAADAPPRRASLLRCWVGPLWEIIGSEDNWRWLLARSRHEIVRQLQIRRWSERVKRLGVEFLARFVCQLLLLS